jgi:Flp pilus assembly protein TadG
VRPRRRRDRGAADALGLVLIAPAVLGLAILVVALSRGVDARAQLRTAAEAAAQAAALERNAADAEAAANRVARAMLVERDACQELAVTVRYPSAPAGDLGTSYGLVEVDLRCSVSNRGIEVVQDGARDEQVTAVAGVDLFRARSEP